LERDHLVLRLGRAADLEVAIFTLSGQRIGSPVRGSFPAGTSAVPLGYSAPLGSYLVRVVSVSGVLVQRAVVE
jgi:hypothetical protein